MNMEISEIFGRDQDNKIIKMMMNRMLKIVKDPLVFPPEGDRTVLRSTDEIFLAASIKHSHAASLVLESAFHFCQGLSHLVYSKKYRKGSKQKVIADIKIIEEFARCLRQENRVTFWSPDYYCLFVDVVKRLFLAFAKGPPSIADHNVRICRGYMLINDFSAGSGLHLEDELMYFKECIRKYPEEVAFYCFKCIWLGLVHRHKQVVSDAKKYVQLFPNSKDLLFCKAASMQMSEDFSPIMVTRAWKEFLDKICIDNRHYPEALYGIAYEELKNLENEVEDNLISGKGYFHRARQAERAQLSCFLPFESSLKTKIETIMNQLSAVDKAFFNLEAKRFDFHAEVETQFHKDFIQEVSDCKKMQKGIQIRKEHRLHIAYVCKLTELGFYGYKFVDRYRKLPQVLAPSSESSCIWEINHSKDKSPFPGNSVSEFSIPFHDKKEQTNDKNPAEMSMKNSEMVKNKQIVFLKNLKLQQPHITDTYLQVNVIEDLSYCFPSVRLVVEDFYGTVQRVFVYNFPIGVDLKKLQNILGFGCQLKILNPKLFIAFDGKPALRVDDFYAEVLHESPLLRSANCRYCGSSRWRTKYPCPEYCGRYYCSVECQETDQNTLFHELICKCDVKHTKDDLVSYWPAILFLIASTLLIAACYVLYLFPDRRSHYYN